MTAPHWGRPPWRVAAAMPRTPLPEACDVAIVGGGLTGLSAALHLARHGAATVLLDAGTIGAGASGRTGAVVLEGTAAGPLEGADACLDALAAVVQEAGIACDLGLGGCWELAHRPRGAVPAPLWQDGETDLYVTGTVPGGTVDPGALLAGLAGAARAAGASLHETAAVRALGPGTTLRLDGATLAAGHVVLAVNAWVPRLVPLPFRLRTALTLAAATEPLDDATLDAIGLGARLPFYTDDLPYLWGRALPDGGLLFGAGLVFPPDGDLERIAIDGAEAAAAFADLEGRVRRLHPRLTGVRIARRWGGPVAFRRGAVPLLGALPDRPHVIVTGAYAGHGIALAVQVGRLVADVVAGRASLPPWGALAADPVTTVAAR